MGEGACVLILVSFIVGRHNCKEQIHASQLGRSGLVWMTPMVDGHGGWRLGKGWAFRVGILLPRL